MKINRLNVLIGLLCTFLLMAVPLSLHAQAGIAREVKDTTYQFTFNHSSNWVPIPVTQKPDTLSAMGFAYQLTPGINKIFLRIDIRKNTGIWSKQYFPQLIRKISKTRNIYEQAYSKDNARETLAATDQLPASIYYDMDKAMIYGFSQAIIKKQEYNIGDILFVGKDVFVSLTFLCTPQDYETYLPEIIKVADTFRFQPNAELPSQPPWFLQSDILVLILKGGFFLVLISVGFGIGTWIEKRHYASIRIREQALLHMPAIPAKLETVMAGNTKTIVRAEMVYGSVVLSEDYFKGFLATLKNFLGGNLTSYESLMDRARREAILRMKADALKADMIVNVRMEGSSIGKEGGANGKGVKTVEMMAYGTAITFAKESNDQVHAPDAA